MNYEEYVNKALYEAMLKLAKYGEYKDIYNLYFTMLNMPKKKTPIKSVKELYKDGYIHLSVNK